MVKFSNTSYLYLGGTIPETEDMNNYLQRSGSSGKLSDNGALMGHFTLSGGGGMLVNSSFFNVLFIKYIFSILLFLCDMNGIFSLVSNGI